ncbi:hypothetical protein Mp_8g04360 [Marchantia polymorpha subsp. ruderalis]|uniref:Uncharacterized protein n=1 Tax=Marchantia polymorpha TaxID=3197 RepID=A0A2R6VZA6_MARPO|nr:hypothetical protein MARPO_0262s0001 [Marchantia polymorpha]BBN18660.1 hypothetical protein Mp_8g04360 [Marchantia polymorpha subsp. ruderalis]|eukprot:PTQ26940.1 hypothetical protein MARPO_0262s0001 [Marchantia polymorpha]
MCSATNRCGRTRLFLDSSGDLVIGLHKRYLFSLCTADMRNRNFLWPSTSIGPKKGVSLDLSMGAAAIAYC